MAAWVGSGIPERAADVGMEISTQTHLREIINIHRPPPTTHKDVWSGRRKGKKKKIRSWNRMNAGGRRIHTSVKEQLGPGATTRGQVA